MSQLEREKLQPQRVHLGALVDREQRDQLVRLAQQEDRSVSATVRLALDDYLREQKELQMANTNPRPAKGPNPQAPPAVPPKTKITPYRHPR